MNWWRWCVPGGALVAILATGALSLGSARIAIDPLLLADNGIGPLRLGQQYLAAASDARLAAPESAFAGPGCGGFDEVRYSGQLGTLPVSVMGMADAGVIKEVELTLDAPLRTPDESSCVTLRDELAAPFVERFGPPGPARTEDKPVSREHSLPVGPVVVVARWFDTGRSCYITAIYREPAAR